MQIPDPQDFNALQSIGLQTLVIDTQSLTGTDDRSSDRFQRKLVNVNLFREMLAKSLLGFELFMPTLPMGTEGVTLQQGAEAEQTASRVNLFLSKDRPPNEQVLELIELLDRLMAGTLTDVENETLHDFCRDAYRRLEAEFNRREEASNFMGP